MNLDFGKLNGLVPAVIQDYNTMKVLMVGFMNDEAYEKTRAEGKVTFYSRTKDRLWTKGEESGNFLFVKDIQTDCDNDTLLVKVEPVGPVCHTGADTCFNEHNTRGLGFLQKLQDLIYDRKEKMPEDSYTTRLFNKGINKIAQKVGEETVELIIEAKDDNEELFLNEGADLFYHLLVLFAQKNVSISDIVNTLEKRHG